MREWDHDSDFFWWWNKINPINDGSFFQSFDPSRWLIEMKICSWVENKKMEFWVYLQPITLWLKQFFDDFSWKAAKVEERSCFFATSRCSNLRRKKIKTPDLASNFEYCGTMQLQLMIIGRCWKTDDHKWGELLAHIQVKHLSTTLCLWPIS